MSTLDPESRAMLDATREVLRPTREDRKRVRGAVEALVAAGAVATAGTATAAAAGASSVATIVKVGAIVVGLGAAGGGLAVWVAPSAPMAPPTRVEHVEAPREPVPTEAPPSAPIAAEVVAPEPAPLPRLRATPTETPSAADVAPEALLVETQLLRGAHEALREGDAARALERLDEHATRFGAGLLAPEREATRVLALCAAGRITDARVAADRFLAVHADSPHASRVRASCAGAGGR